ncbi:ribonuclease E inhibitor RraB [Acinetobacter stercoris]|uniref:Regulator of ribonuclease activity B n=1 Tax=Acinetobacter stercoris TaxID=2126983 RepID=A0A2U3N2S6_9GAMM|nr:ribonuclease E inhibitor RraB [Acinetobacter stercoris]SPL71981.1 Regulator of ribonuclease activity B [Acinetobacter stercoris]
MSRDYEQFPDNDNGNVLWQMYEDGDDLTEPHEIEFSLAFEKQENAEKCAIFLLLEEQKISMYLDEEVAPNLWILSIHVTMEPDYADIVDLEEWFTKIAQQYQGEYDGWGCMTYVYDED